MATIIVTRHNGAIEWLRSHGIEGEVREHLSEADVAELAGHTIIGVLPAVMAAELMARNRVVLLTLPHAPRGVELTPAEMDAGGAAMLELALCLRLDSDPTGTWHPCPSGRPDGMAGDCQAFAVRTIPYEHEVK